ncbi:ABC transporter permease [Patescibacteria group bacterium]|nr:ABC transporter permease [Patescibacteria group bacterium]
MNLANTFSIALKAILLNKKRSFLTMLGVIIGVGSVVLLTSLGTGLQSYVQDQFASLGSNILFVTPGDPFSGGQETSIIESTKPTLKERQYKEILRKHRNLFVGGTTTAVNTSEAKYGTTTKKALLYGVTPSYEEIQNAPAEKGKWFDNIDEEKGKRVVVLGPGIAKELFGNVDPVNKRILLNSQSYTVLGVLEEKGGGFGGPSFDNYIYVPFTTLMNNFNTQVIDSFIFEVKDRSQIEQAKAAIEDVLLEDLKEDEFTVFDQAELLKTINDVLGVLTAGLGGISAISLVVGGIGILNIMLVSVSERTREIGLRKALGATPNVILLQFLIEAALLSVIGGMIGVFIAFLGTMAVQSFFPARILPESILIAFGVSTAIGIIFGAAPARNAAKLSPIEALRSE